MSGHGFTSAFAAQLDDYLAFKKNMGFSGTSRVWYLKQFDAYCAERDRTVFERDTVEGWVRAQLDRSGRYRSWMSYIRDFGRWLQTTGADDAYVLSDRWKAPVVHPRPYLLAAHEIEGFFTAASQLQTPSPWRWRAVAFFTLMHSCGLRTGEARHLQIGQVNLDDGHIDIVWSKGNRSRRLPLAVRVIEILDNCHRTSRAHFGSHRTFFVSATGNQVTSATVGKIFGRIWDQAGLARPPGGRQPRHTTSGTISPARTSNAGWHRAATSLRCCLTYRAIWATRLSTAPTTTFTPLPTSWTTTPASPRRASHCCPRSGSNETQPCNRHPGPFRPRP